MRKLLLLLSILTCLGANAQNKSWVDYVNPYVGNISHLLVPTYPTVHLPNSMLRVYPQRDDFTGEVVRGLPLLVTSHRGRSAFSLSPFQTNPRSTAPVTHFTYDQESITPYYYEVILDKDQTSACFAPSHQSGIYQLKFTQNAPVVLTLNSDEGEMRVDNNQISGFQKLGNKTVAYIYMEVDKEPIRTGIIAGGKQVEEKHSASGKNACVLLEFQAKPQTISLRYGVSFISEEQAKKNLYREQKEAFDLANIAARGKKIWNETLGAIQVKGDESQKQLFYTSLYRCFERPVCISESGQYFSAFDGKVHEDEGSPFYTDDWIWDTYRATHPLRVLIEPEKETHIIQSFLRMAAQMGNDWMPTFPEVTGDSRRMNSNHAVATVIDAYQKGVRGFDLEYAYIAAKKGMEDKTLAPWSDRRAGRLDQFYKEKGYIPALRKGEKETIAEVHSSEKRQPVAVTLGTAYDQWCLSEIARVLGKKEEADYYRSCSFNYRNLFHPKTHFFHPKDENGDFIEPFDYRFSGGMGARDYYGENNGWVYRWDVPHNIPDLIQLMGGNESFNANIETMYREGLGKSKFDFYATLPDHTGNVGQFSMANEPSLHIPYLYNYSNAPWKTQKRIRSLIGQWFRNDLMGVPGDEDGGGMSAFVVFSMMGFYPFTPGLPVYTIGTPFFPYVKVKLANGASLEIIAKNCSTENKYIQSAKLNGKVVNAPWMEHAGIEKGGKLELIMGSVPNKSWGVTEEIPEVAKPVK